MDGFGGRGNVGGVICNQSLHSRNSETVNSLQQISRFIQPHDQISAVGHEVSAHFCGIKLLIAEKLIILYISVIRIIAYEDINSGAHSLTAARWWSRGFDLTFEEALIRIYTSSPWLQQQSTIYNKLATTSW